MKKLDIQLECTGTFGLGIAVGSHLIIHIAIFTIYFGYCGYDTDVYSLRDWLTGEGSDSLYDFMDLNEARELGVIQEINRRLLHPRGMALSVLCDDDGEVVDLHGIYDLRDDLEGMVFHSVDESKVEKFDELKKEKREEELGFMVQPVDWEFQNE